MTVHFINYLLLAIGIFTVLAAVILIVLDKLKGDDMYFNIDVKEQEIKKVIEDAEEILSELNFTSEVIVKEIEEKINSLNRIHKSVDESITQINQKAQVPEQPAPASKEPAKAVSTAPRFKPVTVRGADKASAAEEKPKSKQQLVRELAGQGVSVTDIAKRMNMGQGEVNLILSLKNEEK